MQEVQNLELELELQMCDDISDGDDAPPVPRVPVIMKNSQNKFKEDD